MKAIDFIEGLKQLENTSPEALLAELHEAFEGIGISCTVTEGDLDIAALLPKEVIEQNQVERTFSVDLDNNKNSSELYTKPDVPRKYRSFDDVPLYFSMQDFMAAA